MASTPWLTVPTDGSYIRKVKVELFLEHLLSEGFQELGVWPDPKWIAPVQRKKFDVKWSDEENQLVRFEVPRDPTSPPEIIDQAPRHHILWHPRHHILADLKECFYLEGWSFNNCNLYFQAILGEHRTYHFPGISALINRCQRSEASSIILDWQINTISTPESFPALLTFFTQNKVTVVQPTECLKGMSRVLAICSLRALPIELAQLCLDSE